MKLDNQIDLTEEEEEYYLNSFKPKRSTRKKAGRTHDKGRKLEEPCEVKASRTVLKTSGVREDIA